MVFHVGQRGAGVVGREQLVADEQEADDEATEAALAEMASALPHLTAMVAAELHDHREDPLGWCDSRAEFEFTLDLLLDGLARHLA